MIPILDRNTFSSMISKDEVKHIAKLAKIDLKPKELDMFTSQLSRILDYFKQLGEVHTDRVNETSQVTGLENVVGSDEIYIYENTIDLLNCTPHEIENHSIKIPPIM